MLRLCSALRVLPRDFVGIAVWEVWGTDLVVMWTFQKGPVCWCWLRSFSSTLSWKYLLLCARVV